MKKGKKLLALLLSLCLLLTLLPFSALATEMPAAETEIQLPEEYIQTPEPVEEAAETEKPAPDTQAQVHGSFTEEIPVQINPLYEGLIDPEDIPQPERLPEEPGDVYYPAATYETMEQAGVSLRNYLKSRTESFVLYVKTSGSSLKTIVEDLLEIAFQHTGKPTEGDYLMWQWATWKAESVRSYNNGYYDTQIMLDFTYYTTAAQEKEVDTAVKNLLRTLNVTYKSDYQKVCAVYDYICDNVTYDYAHLEDTSYTRMFTAYAALIDKTAVCQGYALLFYRLMLELGVDNRLIAGEGMGVPHAWNIVKLGNVYYNVDSTWDAGMDEYSFFLRNTVNFPGHARYLEYMSYEFHTEYPMSETDYVDGVAGVPEKIYVYGICGDNAYWTLDREGTLTILGEGDTHSFNIRNGYDDGGPWVYWYDQITALVVEEGITHIGEYAFEKAPKLTSISLPDTLNSIGSHAFAYCHELTKIHLPDSVTSLDRGVFRECTAVTELKLSSSLTVISSEAFRSLESLESVEIPEGVTRLATMAFAYCDKLKDISFPSTLKTIESSALTGCDSLTELNLPDSLESIAGDSFQNCDGLIEVTIPVGVTYANGFSGCDNLEVVILNNNGIVSSHAFANCPKLKSIVFNGEITEISDTAFDRCIALTEITIPESVTYLSGFRNCTNLEKVTLNNSGVIGKDAFANCTKLHDIEIPNTINEIASGAFENCISLTKIVIPYSVETLGGFEGCTGLKEIYFRGQAPDFYFDAFYGVTATAYYPADDSTWTSDVRKNYEGQITWVSYEHEHQPVYAGTVAPTCTEQGYSYSICTVCGTFINDDFVDALGHDTVKHEGKAPSGIQGGWAEYETCTRCDYTTYVELPPEYDVKFVGASLSLKGDIGLNFYAELSERILATPYAYMNFSGSGNDRQVEISRGVLDESDGSYRYSVALNAKNMGDNVTAQAYANGGAVGDSSTLSIKYYADYVINNSEKEVFVNLMKAMLNYGAAAQVEFGYDTENLVNADMTEADRTLPEKLDVAKYAHTWSGEEADIEITSASLLLQSETKIRIYFKLAEGKSLEDFTFTIDGVGVTPTQSGDEYYIEKTNVAAKDLDTMYTFCLGNRQLTYCGLSYVNQVLSYSSDADLLNLVKALYAYNKAANAYFQPDEVEPPHVHTYAETVTEPTCTEDGYTTHTCTFCGDSYADTEVPAVGHNYESAVTDPTCAEDGYTTHICSVCGDSYTDTEVPALGHSYESVVTAPTCTERGFTTHTCTVCGDTYTDTETDALDHDWGEWTVSLEPTVDTEGEETRTCQREGCDETETRAIEKLPAETEPPADNCNNHEYEWVCDPSWEFDTGTCKNCGATKVIYANSSTTSQAVIDAINAYRREAGLNELEWHNGYNTRITMRATELTISFNHARPDGSQSGVAECIATGSSAQGVVDTWFNSNSHNGIIMKSNATYAVAAYNGYYWVVWIR